jgi:hypothetical protein
MTHAAFTAILGGQRSIDGCPAAATMFTLARGTGGQGKLWVALAACLPACPNGLLASLACCW